MKTVQLLSLILPVAAWAAGPAPKEGEIVHAQDRDVYVHLPNYDKSKIPPYTLENPLEFLDGRRVTAADWPARRRELLGIFAKEMYGAEPPPPEAVVTELVDEKRNAVAGYGIRRQYRMWFKSDKSGPSVNWIVWMPRFAKKPVPVISFLNYRGNHELVSDADIPVMTAWSRNGLHVQDHRAQEKTRGLMQTTDHATDFPIRTILARGYAVMSACYCEVSPDPNVSEPDPRRQQNQFAYTGVFELWGRRDEARTDDVTAIGAWGWALSRGLDLAERIPEIDAKRAVVTGCSRLGKAALMAAARDERFAVCVPNQTGGGGAPLAKRDYGENVSTENRMFTHWYCRAYAKYAKEPHRTMPFDQHLLLACVAPRALLVEGFDAPWFDTEGEFLALRAASPVWELLTGSGLPNVKWPADYDTSAIGARLGYVRRSEQHGISAYDWKWTMDFADKVFAAAPYRVGLPCLQSPGETTMGVSWRVNGLSKGVVEYADNPEFRNSRTVKSGGCGLVPIDDKALQVRIEGLKPATTYWYRTVTTPFTDYKNIYDAKLGEPIVSKTFSFTTLGAAGRSHFCMMSDTHARWMPFGMIVKKMKELGPAAIVWNGDATNTTQDKDTAADIFLDPPVADRDFSASIPVLFESGNHDFRGSWISKKEEVVLPRHPAERRGDQWDLKWNFAVRCGDIALIGMDTGEDKPDAHPKWFGLANFSPYRRAQAKWLEEQFARPEIAGAKFKVLCCHIPLWPRNEKEALPPLDGTTVDPQGYANWSRECRDLWAPIFEKNGVQLVVCGHKHRFDYFPACAERPWAMVVGGGPELGVSRSGSDPALFPTVVECKVVGGRLHLIVHDVMNGRIVLDTVIA